MLDNNRHRANQGQFRLMFCWHNTLGRNFKEYYISSFLYYYWQSRK